MSTSTHEPQSEGRDSGTESDNPEATPQAPAVPSFAETAMRLGGKSEDEARRMGAVDAADEQVEKMFEARYQTAASPVHRAVWDADFPDELFGFKEAAQQPTPEAVAVMDRCYQIVKRHADAGTMLDEHRKIRDEIFTELAEAGYWGLLVDREYGGHGVPFSAFAPFLTKIATADPTVAGLASVHACIGAVDPVQAFGNEEQKRRFLPKLASGEALSAFALTEPCAGSDLTALRTTAVRDGDDYVLTGEKLFITNVRPGRTVAVVCLIEEKPAVLIVDLPATETPEFQLKKYGLYALKHAYNQGIIFNGLRVPAANLLDPGKGDGLTIAYHGLNRGRVALCANASGTMRAMLANLLPWARFRVTYGEEIIKRELVRRRCGYLAGLIVACDALTDWTANLLDAGFRGEMECILAKIFGSESQKEATIELTMKTHGGRSFLHGHWFGDNVHDLLAPCIYEGEGEMLGMAFFKSLVKEHGRKFFEPIGRILHEQGIKNPHLANPAHAWALRKPLAAYSRWMATEKVRLTFDTPGSKVFGDAQTDSKDAQRRVKSLQDHFHYGAHFLRHSRLEISSVMRKHQLRLPDRQCRMAELSLRVQAAVVIVCTALYGARQADDTTGHAADVICTHLRAKLEGARPSDRDLKSVVALGSKVAEGQFQQIRGIGTAEVMMPYSKRED